MSTMYSDAYTPGASSSSSSSTSSSSPSSNYIFMADTKEAHVLKSIAELLYNANCKLAPFRIDADGISLCKDDVNHHQLISLKLERNNFPQYICTRPLCFFVNCELFYKMLKTIKKKDRIVMYIKDDDSFRWTFCVKTADENQHTNTFIRITYTQPHVLNEPVDYGAPTIVGSKEFQKMKNLHNIDKFMEVTSPHPGYIRFYCEGKNVYEREVVLGNENTHNNDASMQDVEEYRQTFHTNYITNSIKCSNCNPNSYVHIFVKRDLPLKIKMKAGNLGELCLYVKSKQRIDLEEKLEAEKKKQALAAAAEEAEM